MKSNGFIKSAFAGLLSVFLFTGCLCDPDYCRMPNLLHPGHISEQQDRMKQFDPFARSDIGPRIDGDRPHGADRATDTPKHLEEYKARR